MRNGRRRRRLGADVFEAARHSRCRCELVGALGGVANLRAFGATARTRLGDIATTPWPGSPAALLAAFTLNELADAARERVLQRLVERGERGDIVLVVEPVAGFVAPWWNRWRDVFAAAGGRAADWRFSIELPAIVAKLDRAAGLDHRTLTGRSLWFG